LLEVVAFSPDAVLPQLVLLSLALQHPRIRAHDLRSEMTIRLRLLVLLLQLLHLKQPPAQA
jgi:hypothetical protein